MVVVSRLFISGEAIPVTVDADAMPCSFTWNGQPHTVERILSRWRVDLFWWRSRVCREYFKVITESGLLVVLYRDGVRQAWHVQRIYD